ncbi:hypothetical protein Pcinc_007288 [Petrolisthes cinctipes]|uniref:Uncharacterized protein n=1 Tax=Petrolisthes cinctipes TaxID=88211 RepID=A0AAE1G9P8_PETCI|nr:hypothetical protein Pcinc_007288 [Petrolisthes cinctipes]
MEGEGRNALYSLYSTIIIYHQSKYPTHGQALKTRPEQLQPDIEAGPEERQLHTLRSGQALSNFWPDLEAD